MADRTQFPVKRSKTINTAFRTPTIEKCSNFTPQSLRHNFCENCLRPKEFHIPADEYESRLARTSSSSEVRKFYQRLNPPTDVPIDPPANRKEEIKETPSLTEQKEREDKRELLVDSLERTIEKQLNHEMFSVMELIGKGREMVSMVSFEGRFGSVFKGKNMQTNEFVAIKMIEFHTSLQKLDGIVNEVNLLKETIQCPYVVEYQGFYVQDDGVMVVMEHCDCSLADILQYCPFIRFSELHISSICAAIVKALAYLHSIGIVHRDIKSSNILIKASGEIKLADFGVARQLQETSDKMKTLTGSPYYCSPEVITRDSYDNKVDLWSLGIVAIEMAETKVPYSTMDPLQVIFRIPKEEAPVLKEPKKWTQEFKDFLSKCLQKNPHPFVLQGSSPELLSPLVSHCLSTLITKKAQDLTERMDDEKLQSGTIVCVNRDMSSVNLIYDPHRPKGISDNSYQHRRFFGVPLRASSVDCQMRNQTHFSDLAIDYLMKTAMQVEGLFRISGSISLVNEIKDKFDLGTPIDITDYEPHAVSGALKLYLRELPEPLFTDDLYEMFIAAAKIHEKDMTHQLQELIKRLPAVNKKLFKRLMEMSAELIKNVEETKMTAQALGRCLAGNMILRSSSRPVELLLQDTQYMDNLVVFCIENQNELF